MNFREKGVRGFGPPTPSTPSVFATAEGRRGQEIGQIAGWAISLKPREPGVSGETPLRRCQLRLTVRQRKNNRASLATCMNNRGAGAVYACVQAIPASNLRTMVLTASLGVDVDTSYSFM